MTEKKSFFSETVKPVLVLLVICLVVSVLLGVTNAVTAPIIQRNKEEQALRDRQELLPDAVGFTEYDYPDDRVKGVHVDTGGSGMIVVVGMTGYGGIVTTTIAIDTAGSVLDIRVDAVTETKGIGSKVAESAFLDGFKGYNFESEPVDVIAGATYSSETVINSVTLALEVFKAVEGGTI